MNFDQAFESLVSSWMRHEQLKHDGANLSDLLDARIDLDRARVQAAVSSHR